MRILVVKLSSLGDIVHALPVVHDLLEAHADAQIDWVVEPTFAPLLSRVRGLHGIIEFPLRRWRRAWWQKATRTEWRTFRRQLQRTTYDAVIDLQGLTKSAVVARLANGRSHGLANRTDGSSYQIAARWLVHNAIRVEPRIHALDRSRELAAKAIGYLLVGPPNFGLQASADHSPAGPPALAFVHGSSRSDKLWPEEFWVEIGRRASARGWRIVLPRAGAPEHERAMRIASALGSCAEVWPEMDLGALVERLGSTQGVIGVDSGLSHIAVALGLPHVQIYNFGTSWRTGPQVNNGCRRQISIESVSMPSLEAVWNGWAQVSAVRPGSARAHD